MISANYREKYTCLNPKKSRGKDVKINKRTSFRVESGGQEGKLSHPSNPEGGVPERKTTRIPL